MSQTMRVVRVVLIAALLVGTSAISAQAAGVQGSCAPAGSNGARPYWSYYQFPSVGMCGTSIIEKSPYQSYWSYYQYPPRHNFFLAQQP